MNPSFEMIFNDLTRVIVAETYWGIAETTVQTTNYLTM